MSDETVKQSIDYVECKLKKDDLLKELASKTKNIRTLEKQIDVLKTLPYLGWIDRAKYLLKTKGYLLSVILMIPLLVLLGKTVFELGYKNPMFMQTESVINRVRNILTHSTMLFVWITILVTIGLIIFGIIASVTKYVLFVFSDRYLVNELKVQVKQLELRQQEHGLAIQELTETKKELEKFGKKK